MAIGTCCSPFRALSRAAAKYTASVVRRAGMGAVHPDWAARAAVCETCPLRVLAGRVSYCGRPLQHQPLRDPAEDGCGCPTRDKARDPQEHCPLTPSHRPANPSPGRCDCKWCQRPRAQVR
jgi:hypothetical protein